MLNAQSLGRRSWVGIGWLLALGIAALVAIANIYAGLVFLVIAAITGVTVARIGGMAQPHMTEHHTSVGRVAWASSPQRSIYAEDGTEQAAFVVPAANIDGYQAALTAEGFVLVNDNGEIVHRLAP